MKKYKILTITILTAISWHCSEPKDLFNIDSTGLKQVYKPNESIQLKIENKKEIAIDSVVYFANEVKLGTAKKNNSLTIKLNQLLFGTQDIKALVYYEGKNASCITSFELVSNITPKMLAFTLVNTYNHDIEAYTQGLEFHNGILYEGTGQRGESSLRKTDYKTGTIPKKIGLDPQYFGEGITFFNNKLYQLTWQEKVGFIYNPDTFEKEKTFDYFKDIEGWGLTHNDKYLIMSDGSNTIYFLDPNTQKLVKSIQVYTDTSKIEQLNELEWIDGKIWANVYQKDAIAIINPENGAVEAVLNLAELKSKIKQHPEVDVLNGIAYNPKTKTIFVTGKNWDKMFEIKINP